MPLFTFGHGTADRGRLVELLSAAGIAELVDGRTDPGSRRNPEVAREGMARWLPEHGIGYDWERRLSGWRQPPPDSPDIGLRNRSFAGYAAHMRTREFLDAIRNRRTWHASAATAFSSTTVISSHGPRYRCSDGRA